MNRGRLPPGRLFFLLPTKERTKENCRCFDAADPRLGGCTPPRPPKRKSEGPTAKRTQYYCPFLTPSGLPPLLSRVFPRTPAVFNGCYNLGRQPAKGSPFRGAGRASWPEGSRRALRHHPFPVNHPPTAKGEGCRPPLPLQPTTRLQQSVGAGHARPATLPLLPMCLLHRREGS